MTPQSLSLTNTPSLWEGDGGGKLPPLVGEGWGGASSKL